MNQLETNLILWAICSIILFEMICIICLCRCCFNRIKSKTFYLKRDELEYLQNGTQSKFQSTILRPPHADELALVGTIRTQNSAGNYKGGIQNPGFYHDNEDERIPTIRSQSSQQWIELQPSRINTTPLSPAEYEIHSHPTDDYLYTNPYPRPTIVDFHRYREDDELTNNRFRPLRRPDIIYPQPQRLDTSTDSYAMNYSSVVPKSILKGSSGTTPPPDESLSSKDPMRFANISRLNDVEWEVPREFQTIIYDLSNDNQPFRSNENLNKYDTQNELSNRQRTQSATVDQKTHISRVFIPREHEMNNFQPNHIARNDTAQQQAFEY